MRTTLIDTETCGLVGVPVTIQWAEKVDDTLHDIHLHHIWTSRIQDTLDLIEFFVDNRVVFHNARFDWFHLSKIYNMLSQSKIKSYIPLDYDMDYWADLEFKSQYGPCLKPRACVDTLLLASKSEDQSAIMATKPVWVRRVPVGLAETLRNHLESLTDLPWILFAKRKNQDAPLWGISDCKNLDGEFDLGFKDLKLSFSPSQSLKHLSAYLCGHNVKHKFEDIAYATFPAEEGFAPFAYLLSNEKRDWLYDGKPTWPALLQEHIDHWYNNENAQEYAIDDITMLDLLYTHFGSPKEDEDSMIACQVGSVRLRGFNVDMLGVRSQSDRSMKIVGTAKLNVNSPKQVLGFVSEAFDSVEQFVLADGCDQKVIDEIKSTYTLKEREICPCMEEEDDEDEDGLLDLGNEREVTIIDGVCQRCNGSSIPVFPLAPIRPSSIFAGVVIQPLLRDPDDRQERPRKSRGLKVD